MKAAWRCLVCRSWLTSWLLNLDLAWPRRFVALQADLQYPVAILGVDAVRIYVFRQGDHATKLSVKAFLPVVGRFFLDRQAPLAGDQQQVLLNREIDALRIQARSEQVDVHGIRGGAYIGGWESPTRNRADARGRCPAAKELVHVLLHPSELIEQAFEVGQTAEHFHTSLQMSGSVLRWPAALQRDVGSAPSQLATSTCGEI